ncbi:universal stress protein [Phenylobacterium immobile]|uniref:universal stress protein n=1 Tax=Phenylobacterium immobile TaxID=21 RepID=UPI000AD491F9|nr:universal stress protein [Phenylobacterium immobile]
MFISEPLKESAGHARVAGFSSILTHAEPGLQSSHRIEIAATLARSLNARLIGVGAETFEPVMMTDPMAGPAGDWISLLQEQVNADLAQAEHAFRRDAAGADLEWRSFQDYPTRAVARASRAADLIVASARAQNGAVRSVDPAELIVEAGRPVLIVPNATRRLHGKTVVIAWKDTREARRAVADAMPFLKQADDVVVQAICPKDGNEAAVLATNDVAAALGRHGVCARGAIIHGREQDVPELLCAAVEANGADLIVAGAYGHSRAKEWMLGGVTRALLHEPPCFVLFSH